MKAALILFNNVTALDFVGFYDPFTRLKSMGFLKELVWDICAYSRRVHDDRRIGFTVGKVKPDLSEYDMIFIPGGFGARQHVNDKEFIEWIKGASNVKLKVSVSTGSLILGAAGFLEGKKATTHPALYSVLEKYCGEVVKERIVTDRNTITAGGVTASIDLGLYVCELLAGKEIREKIQEQIDFPYYK